jgi:hypothetical protein
VAADWAESLVASGALAASERYGRVLALARDERGQKYDGELLVSRLLPLLRDRPDLVEAWQLYSWDKRWSPSPYWEAAKLEVGLYDSGYRDVETCSDAATACAAFIAREIAWLRERHSDGD